jgi:hypothetical protein
MLVWLALDYHLHSRVTFSCSRCRTESRSNQEGEAYRDRAKQCASK